MSTSGKRSNPVDAEAEETRRRAAFHEAGHAVFATLVGRVVTTVTLQETKLEHARIDEILAGTGPLSPDDQDYCVQEIQIGLAGCAGERVQFGSGHPNRAAYKFDRANITGVRRALWDRAERRALTHDLMPKVVSTLKNNEDAVFDVAKELLALGSQTGDQVRAIVARHRISHFTNAVRQCVDARNWYGALALALTLPDICAGIEYPGERSSKVRYSQWFDQYLGPTYRNVITVPGMVIENVFLTGLDCYALRCAYLHQGADDTEAQSAREALSKFFFTTMRAHRVRLLDTALILNVRRFCLELASGAEAWALVHQHDPRVVEELGKLLTIQRTGFSPPGVRFFQAAPDPECEPLAGTGPPTASEV